MKKLVLKMKRLGLSPKKEFIIYGIVLSLNFALFITLAIILKNIAISLISLSFAVVFSILYLGRYGTRINNINTSNLLEFAELFSFFRIYIKNGYNVYNALKEISLFANDNLRVLFEKLITEIDEDKSVQPFVNFAKNFDEIIVEEMMIAVYQMVDDGEQSNYLIQFEYIFDKFSDSINAKQLQKKEGKLATLSSAPLIGTCFLIIVITIGIIGIIGELTNGI